MRLLAEEDDIAAGLCSQDLLPPTDGWYFLLHNIQIFSCSGMFLIKILGLFVLTLKNMIQTFPVLLND